MRNKKILIVGAGVAGQDVLYEIKKSPELGYSVVGFIDDNPSKKGQKVSGVKILGGRYLIQKLVKHKGIDEVIIAIPSAQGEEISDIVKICSDSQVPFKIVPRVKEIIEGTAHLRTLRRVRVEDLLRKPIIKSDVPVVKKFFHNKKVLVTGAAGSIGSELSFQIAAYKPKKIILLDLSENGIFNLQSEMRENFPGLSVQYIIGNIQDRRKVARVMSFYKPNYVFHAAAHKHVPLMEDHPEEAVRNNIFGTLNLAQEAKRANVERFILISTDKAANPVNVMGMTKLITEGIVKKLNTVRKTKFITVRFGNVLDSRGSVLTIFRKQIESGGPITITHKDMTRYFMTIPEAAQLIHKAALMGQGGEIFILDMGKPIRIVNLAQNLIRLSGLVPNKDIKIVYTGIRKGEKLHEQLFNDNELLVATKDERIYKTESLGFDVTKLPRVLKKLKTLADLGDGVGIRKEFKNLVKNFPA